MRAVPGSAFGSVRPSGFRMSSAPDLMTVADYAARRGVSDSYIRRMRRQGKLVTEGRLVRVAASDHLLDNITDPVRGGNRTPISAGAEAGRRGGENADAVNDAIRRERLAKAQLAEIELAERAGELIRRDGVERTVYTLARAAINGMQGMRVRLRLRLAAESDPAKVDAMLAEEFDALCAEMRTAASKLSRELGPDAAVEPTLARGVDQAG